MAWFVVHAIERPKLVGRPTEFYECYENIIMVKASTLNKAIKKIKNDPMIAKTLDSKPDWHFKLKEGSFPGKYFFEGIKKVVKLNVPKDIIKSGIQVSRSYFRFKDKESFEKYHTGKEVECEYIGSAESEATNKRDDFKSNFPSFSTDIEKYRAKRRK